MVKFASTDSLKMQNDSILLSAAYLAPVEYYTILANSKEILLEGHEYYQKQTYRSRCKISTANGTMDLSIPVDKSGKQLIRDIRISAHNDWQTHHWRSIESAYSSSPFFEYYSDDIQPFFEKKWVFLWDFNLEIQQVICNLLEITPNIAITDTYKMSATGILDLRDRIHPKKNSLIEIGPYYQVFEQKYGFIANLSILDLLFNMGNEAQLIIKNQQLSFI